MGDELDEAQRQSFLRKYGITAEDFAVSGLEWSLLVEISQCHSIMNAELQAVGSFVSERLRSVPDVHSLRMRIKDCDHLVEKIIRKKLDDHSLSVDVSSYEKTITDLVGVRAIHLFKDQWLPIHHFVKDTWDLHEDPIAYVRAGDPPKLQDAFRDAGLGIKEHPFGYRSVHYVIKANPTRVTRLVELQVRTIFEEGWSEIDHLVRYPLKSADPNLEGFLQIFNRFAGGADEMGTFTKMLDGTIRKNARYAREKEAEISAAISKLKITSEEKAHLEKTVAELQASSQHFTIGPQSVIVDMNPIFRSADSPNVSVSGSLYLGGIFGSKTCTACGKNAGITIGNRCPHCGAEALT